MNAATSIIPFENEEFGTIRTVEQDGKVMFCGKDVATALGYSNPNKALRDHTRGERIVTPLETSGGIQQVQFITEGDLYRLIASSKLPSAQRFESWVFDEVFPSIRKRGGYMVEVPNETPEQTMARASFAATVALRGSSLPPPPWRRAGRCAKINILDESKQAGRI